MRGRLWFGMLSLNPKRLNLDPPGGGRVRGWGGGIGREWILELSHGDVAGASAGRCGGRTIILGHLFFRSPSSSHRLALIGWAQPGLGPLQNTVADLRHPASRRALPAQGFAENIAHGEEGYRDRHARKHSARRLSPQ